MTKRIFAALICLVLLTALLPASAGAAANVGIAPGLDGLSAGDTLYFGSYSAGGTHYDVPWTVLGSGTLSEASTAASGALELLSKYTLGTASITTTSNVSGPYSNSPLRTAMTAIYDGFDSRERGVVAEVTLSGDSMAGDPSKLGYRAFPEKVLEETPQPLRRQLPCAQGRLLETLDCCVTRPTASPAHRGGGAAQHAP